MDRSEFYRLDAVLDEFDRQWHAEQRPRIEDLLSEVSSIDAGKVLEELLLIEIDCRRRKNERPERQEYEERFPGYRDVVGRAFANRDSADRALRESCTTATTEFSRRPDADVQASPGVQVGPYELVEPLGRGGFGEVWLGRRTGALATTYVAIKIPRNSESMMRIIRDEARSWVRASGHPNVVPIIEADVYGGLAAIVSEYVAGGTLAAKIREHGRLAVSLAVETAIGVLCGLEFLHAKGIVHRDLKPANTLLQHGVPRLTDFGLAWTGESQGGIAGTPAYMAPEALRGECSVQTDLWSTGVVLFEMLTGSVPFKSDRLSALIQEICDGGSVSIPPEIPSTVRQVLARALHKKAPHRFKSAAEMRAALSACRNGLPRYNGAAGDGDIPHHFTISVTGSMRSDPWKVRRRLQSLLAPYRAPLTTWYAGSNGVVDEVAAELLVAAGQQVFLVGYTRSDLSERALRLAEQYDLPFIDAQGEDVPREPNAPSERDIFFATKSDLVILVWDRKSPGTRELHTWLRRNHRDHLIVYL